MRLPDQGVVKLNNEAQSIQRYTVAEVSLLLRVPKSKIISAIRDGVLRATFNGVGYFMARGDVEKWTETLEAEGKIKFQRRRIVSLYHFGQSARGRAIMSAHPDKAISYHRHCDALRPELEAYAREQLERASKVLKRNSSTENKEIPPKGL